MSEATQDQPALNTMRVGVGPPEITQAVRSFLIIALSVASAVLSVAQLTVVQDPAAFLEVNRLELIPRISAIDVAAVAGIIIASLTLLLTRRSADPTGLRLSISKLVAPFSVSCFVPILFTREAWQDREAAYLVLLLAVGLSLEWLLRMAFEVLHQWRAQSRWLNRVDAPLAAKLLRWIPLLVTLALVAYYAMRIGHLTNVSHTKLDTRSSDLAEYDNMFFNALSGHPFRSPAIAGHLKNWSTLQGHAEFGLYLLLPFYALAPGARALLWIQSTLVALTAVPVYLLGAARLGRLAGVVFACAFLMMPAAQQPNFYDFHFTPLSMFFVAWLLYFVFRLSQVPTSRKFRIATYVALALALLCREDIAIGTAVLGAFLVLAGILVRDGFVVMTLSACYLVIMKFVVMPLFGTWWFDTMYEDLKSPGAGGFGAVVLTLISNPAFTLRTLMTEPKFIYFLHMTAPLLALWLRRPILWLALLTGFVSTLLATNRPPLFQSSFQYTYLWLPYVVAASIVAARRIRGGATLTALMLVALAAADHFCVFPWGDRIKGGFGTKTFEVSEAEQKRLDNLNQLIAMIPPDASVSATESEGPHVSARPVMYSLKYTLGRNPDFLLVGPHLSPGARRHLRQALQSGKYGIVAQRGRFVLAERGADPKSNSVLWQRAGRRR